MDITGKSWSQAVPTGFFWEVVPNSNYHGAHFLCVGLAHHCDRARVGDLCRTVFREYGRNMKIGVCLYRSGCCWVFDHQFRYHLYALEIPVASLDYRIY
jgi:hypothetical protein